MKPGYSKMTPKEWAECHREFSQFGYDPYNSLDIADAWWGCINRVTTDRLGPILTA